MNTRRGRSRYKGRGRELLVTEIILPQQGDQSPDVSETDKQRHKDRDQINPVKRDNEISAFCGLTVLENPPLANYFPGTKKKKYKKKKPKLRNTNYFIDDLTFCDSFTATNEELHETTPNSTFRSESLEKKYLKRKIFNYEIQLRDEQDKNYRRQRLLENEVMEQQENLAETWLGLFRRRKELEENRQGKGLPCYSYNRPVNISLLPGKYWNDETDEKRRKAEERKEKAREKSPPKLGAFFEDLESDLTKKLVFVDVSDDSGDDSCRPPPFSH